MPLVEPTLRKRVSYKAIDKLAKEIKDYTDKDTEKEKTSAYVIWRFLNNAYDTMDTNDRIRVYGVLTELLIDYGMLVGLPKEMQALVQRFKELN